MKKILLFGLFVPLAGCGGAYMTHVYGRSGATFTAPSVCAALVLGWRFILSTAKWQKSWLLNTVNAIISGNWITQRSCIDKRTQE